MRIRYAAAAGVAVIALAVGLFLFLPAHRVLGTNTVHPFLPVAPVEPGEQVCDTVAEVPPGTGSVRLKAESFGGVVEGLRLKISAKPNVRLAGSVERADNGVIDVPITPAPGSRDVTNARVCVGNGSAREITLYGEFKRPPGPRVRYAPPVRSVRAPSFVFIDADASGWFSHKGKILDRFRFGHAGAVGAWALWLAGLLAAVVSALAMWRVTRDAERP